MPIQEIPESTKMHAVPQNFMDVEFKLIGDLTMRQFTYLLVCGVAAYIVYSVVHGIFKWPLVLVLVVLGLGLAFVPIQERGLDVWIVNLIRAIYTPTQRIWKKQPFIPPAFAYQHMQVVKQEMITLAPTSSRRKLEEFLKYKTDADDQDPLDIPEKAYVMKVREAFVDAQVPVVQNQVRRVSNKVIDRTIGNLDPAKLSTLPEPIKYTQKNEPLAYQVVQDHTPVQTTAPVQQQPEQFSFPAAQPVTMVSDKPFIPVQATTTTPIVPQSTVKTAADEARISKEAEEIIQRMQGKPKVPPIKFEQPKSPDYFAPAEAQRPAAVPAGVPVQPSAETPVITPVPKGLSDDHSGGNMFGSLTKKLFAKKEHPAAATPSVASFQPQPVQFTAPNVQAEETARSQKSLEPKPLVSGGPGSAGGKLSLDDIWEGQL